MVEKVCSNCGKDISNCKCVDKVVNIIIPTKKLFLLIKSLKEERRALIPDEKEPKIELRRYKLKVQYELLNDMLQHYGIDNLMVKLLPNKHIKELVKAIPKEDKEQ